MAKADAPKTPDYTGASLVQGQLAKDTALSTTGLNRPNEINPYGTKTWSYTPQPRVGGNGNALTGGLASTIVPNGEAVHNTSANLGAPSKLAATVIPNKNAIYNPKGNTWVVDGQVVKNADGSVYTGSARPTTTLGQTKVGSSVAGGDGTWGSLLGQSESDRINPGDWTVTTSLSPEQQKLFDINNQYKQTAGTTAQQLLDAYTKQGTQDAITPDSFSGDRSRVEKALYDRTTSLYGDQFANDEAAMRTRLVNQGLDENSDAFRRQVSDFETGRNRAYQNAADSAVLAGGQEQSRLLANLLQSRGSTLNEAQALANGTQAQMPQFQANSQAGTPQSPDITGAIGQTYASQLGNVNAQNAQTAQTEQGLATLASMIYMFSDRRLKSMIVKLGKGFGDLDIYEYDIFGRRERGYMAQEVQARFPEAVMESASGYLMVNYNAIGGRP